jgi:putative colanic acid biosynthesis UDP-glucose lipid carrier transferase
MGKKYLTYDAQLFLIVDALLSLGFGLILANLLNVDGLIGYLYLLITVCLLQIFVFRSSYQRWRLTSISEHLKSVLKDWISIVLIILAFLFLFKKTGDFSRFWLIIWFITVATASMSLRLFMLFWLRKHRLGGQNQISIGLVCNSSTYDYILSKINAYPWSGYKVVELINVDHDDSWVNINITNCQELWISLPMHQEAELRAALYHFRHQSIDIRYIPSMSDFNLINHSVSHMMDMTLINLSSTPLDNQGYFFKRLEDIVLSVFFTILLSPLMVLVAILVKFTSPGPILFKQKRHGWNGQQFSVYKFRSMYVHHETPGVITQATLNDKRVTRLGRFLRASSLDELPQFINVIQGSMSIVGPRPHALEHNEYYKELIPKYMWRHKVKPGITGWAQINGLRGETVNTEQMKRRVDYDLFYIENWSIWFDMKIITLTFFSLLRNRNVY